MQNGLNPGIFKSYDVRGNLSGRTKRRHRIPDRTLLRRDARGQAHCRGTRYAPLRAFALRRVRSRSVRIRHRHPRYRARFDRCALFRGREIRPRRRRDDHGIAQPGAIQRHEANALRGTRDLARHRARRNTRPVDRRRSSACCRNPRHDRAPQRPRRFRRTLPVVR